MDAVVAGDADVRPAAPVPPERAPGFFAFMRAFRDNPITAFGEDTFRAPLVHRRRRGFVPAFLTVAAPELVRRVLLDRVDIYEKGDVVRRRLAPMVGDGILIAETESWLPQRRIVQPLFRPRETASFLPAMVAAAEAARDRLAAAGPGAIADMTEALDGLTYDVIARTAFSGDTIEDPARFSAAIGDYFDTLGRVDLASFLGLPEWVPTLGRIRARPALALFRRQVGGILARRRALIAARGEGAAPADLLTALLLSKDPKTGAAMSPERVYDNAVVFLAAGHETTSNTLQWVLYLLSVNPAWEERVAAEIRDAIAGDPVGVATLDHLVLTRRVVEEALRLYPPAPFIPRVPRAPDEIGGVAVRPGDMVFTSPYITQRHRALWDAPDAFRPERFERRPPEGAYFPFGIGPRGCLGARFAIQEALAALAVLLSAFRFETVAPEKVSPLATITLRPARPLLMRVARR